MKKNLLLSFFLILGLAAFGQSDRSMAFNNSTPSAKYQIKVFPNPFTSYIKVDDKGGAVKHIVIYNLLGKKMKTFVAALGESYSVDDLPRGFYLVQMQGDRNKIIKTQRLQKR